MTKSRLLERLKSELQALAFQMPASSFQQLVFKDNELAEMGLEKAIETLRDRINLFKSNLLRTGKRLREDHYEHGETRHSENELRHHRTKPYQTTRSDRDNNPSLELYLRG